MDLDTDERKFNGHMPVLTLVYIYMQEGLKGEFIRKLEYALEVYKHLKGTLL
jgi:hypothetical protein